MAEGNSGLIVRAAGEVDLADMLVLYRHLHSSDPELAPEIARAAWRVLLSHPGTTVFLGRLASGEAVASCTMHTLPNMTRSAAPYAVIENVVTHEAQRRRGYGRAVLAHALARAWQQGCYKVMLMTGRKDDATLRFYESAGFRRDKTAFLARPPEG